MKKQPTADVADEPVAETVYTDSVLSSNADTGVLVLTTDRPDGSRVEIAIPGQTLSATAYGGQIWATYEPGFAVHTARVDAID